MYWKEWEYGNGRKHKQCCHNILCIDIYEQHMNILALFRKSYLQSTNIAVRETWRSCLCSYAGDAHKWNDNPCDYQPGRMKNDHGKYYNVHARDVQSDANNRIDLFCLASIFPEHPA